MSTERRKSAFLCVFVLFVQVRPETDPLCQDTYDKIKSTIQDLVGGSNNATLTIGDVAKGQVFNLVVNADGSNPSLVRESVEYHTKEVQELRRKKKRLEAKLNATESNLLRCMDAVERVLEKRLE